MQQTIQIWLENKPGALMRVAGILTAKGCNIETLTVAPDPWREGVSKMTIVVGVEPRLQVRVVNEMNRLVDVHWASDSTHERRGLQFAGEPSKRTTC